MKSDVDLINMLPIEMRMQMEWIKMIFDFIADISYDDLV